jgi:hypothetical protein
MAKYLLFALIPLLLSGLSANVFACTCGETTLSESKSAATAVFLGRIKNKIKSDAVEESGVEVTFEVERVWKGQIQKKVRIYSGATADLYGFLDLCSPEFKVGDRYIVFAAGENLLANMMCSHTARIDTRNKNWASRALGRGKRPKT